MTLTTLTFALTITTATAQAAPVPSAPPILPAAQGMPVMPAIPAFETSDIDLPAIGMMLPDITEAMRAAELALARMPDFDTLGLHIAAEADFAASLGRLAALDGAALAFDGAMLAQEVATMAHLEAGEAARAFSFQQNARRDSEAAAYERARASLDRRNWDDAITRFTEVVAMKGSRADAALYWKAFAESRAGRNADAQASIATLRSDYPKSRYLNDASALEVELKRGGGQPLSPDTQQDEDLKLLAIQGLQHSAPEQTVPLLEKILASSNSPRIKERALYVLALSDSPRSREVLMGIAKGGGNPDLQRKAIDYLALHGADNQALLEDIYRSTNDIEIRSRVLRGYMQAGDRARLLAIAQTDPNAELRTAAIRYLGNTGGHAELVSLYAKESSPAVRAQIVRGLGQAGAADQLRDVVRNEENAEVRLQAIRAFGMIGRKGTGNALREMYATETTPDGKRSVIQAMHMQDDAEGLVGIARRETDPELKEYLVRRLSTMTQSKVALDYLMEIINK